jgi:flavin reductase (DIM6/NTAB) family NADH-FMN oxidoreductase RutF
VSNLDAGAGDPCPEPDLPAAYDELVGSTDPVMLVVTAAAAGQRDGCLVGFHSQCGIEPRRHALWMSKANRTTRLVSDDRCTHVGVHLLRADQHELARRFGAVTGDEVDKLAGVALTTGPAGTPLLADCTDRLVGRKVALTEVDADHLCLVVEPVEVFGARRRPAAGWLHLSQVSDLVAGHAPDDSP